MKKLKHSKYKNTGILFEMLVRKLTSETLSSNKSVTVDIIKKYLVEVKPWKQTQEPKATKGKKKSNLLYEQVAWKNNCDKWSFAREFAKKHGMDFIIITEKELN